MYATNPSAIKRWASRGNCTRMPRHAAYLKGQFAHSETNWTCTHKLHTHRQSSIHIGDNWYGTYARVVVFFIVRTASVTELLARCARSNGCTGRVTHRMRVLVVCVCAKSNRQNTHTRYVNIYTHIWCWWIAHMCAFCVSWTSWTVRFGSIEIKTTLREYNMHACVYVDNGICLQTATHARTGLGRGLPHRYCSR